MARNNKKRQLNAKQSSKISMVISILYFICMLVNGLLSNLEEVFIYYLFIVCITGSLFIYFVFYFLIFKGEEKERTEKAVVTIQYLSYKNFKQVSLSKNCDKYIMWQILKKEGYKFYAQLTEDNNIQILVKDKHNQEVYSTEINSVYFDYNFDMMP